MKKIIALSLSIVLFVFTSCESGLFNCKYKAEADIYDKTADLDKLWYLYDSDNNFVGLDTDTLEKKISFSSPDTSANCNYVEYINDKFYVVQNGGKNFLSFNAGSSIFVLDKNLDLLANIRCGKNPSNIVQIGSRLVADSSYFNYDSDGNLKGIMTLIDAETDTTERIVSELPGLISNKGKNWVYNGKVYITTQKNFMLEMEPAVVIYDADTFEKLEETTEFNSSSYSSLDTSYSLVIKNQLWLIYTYYPIIEIYDLDTRKMIKEIDCRKSIPQIKDIPGDYHYDGTPCYIVSGILLKDNTVYFTIEDRTSNTEDSEEAWEYTPDPDLFVSVSTESLEVADFVSLEKNYYCSEIFLPESKPESAYIYDRENVFEINITNGKEIQAVNLRKE